MKALTKVGHLDELLNALATGMITVESFWRRMAEHGCDATDIDDYVELHRACLAGIPEEIEDPDDAFDDSEEAWFNRVVTDREGV